jgi:hypothetical protein
MTSQVIVQSSHSPLSCGDGPCALAIQHTKNPHNGEGVFGASSEHALQTDMQSKSAPTDGDGSLKTPNSTLRTSQTGNRVSHRVVDEFCCVRSTCAELFRLKMRPQRVRGQDMDADKRPSWVEPIDKAQAEVLKLLLAQQSFDIGSTVSAGGGEGCGSCSRPFVSG